MNADHLLSNEGRAAIRAITAGRHRPSEEETARRRAISRARQAWRQTAPAGQLQLHRSYVYLAFDRAERLLYVGVTDNLGRRLAAHANGSAWWPRAQVMRWEEFLDRFKAEQREADLIRELEPEFNVTLPWPIRPRVFIP